jgi:hypothetical protein
MGEYADQILPDPDGYLWDYPIFDSTGIHASPTHEVDVTKNVTIKKTLKFSQILPIS